MNKSIKSHVIMFIIMVIVGMLFNPMNMLAFKINDLYFSITLFYGGLLMASNMIWAHEIIHYLTMGHINMTVFFIGLLFSIISVFLLRKQLFVDDKQWLKRMIPHHSTALTTSKLIHERTDDKKIKKLSKDIIETQEKEIILMKKLINLIK